MRLGVFGRTKFVMTDHDIVLIEWQYLSPLQVNLKALQSKIHTVLTSSGISAEHMGQVDTLLSMESPFAHPFAEVETPHRQLSFY